MIFFETAGQARLFLLLLGAGILCAVLYDAASLIRRKLPRALGTVTDGLWCLLTALLCGAALMLGGEATLRLYALLGLFCGAGVYCLGARRAVRFLLRRLRRILPRGVREKEAK